MTDIQLMAVASILRNMRADDVTRIKLNGAADLLDRAALNVGSDLVTTARRNLTKMLNGMNHLADLDTLFLTNALDGILEILWMDSDG